MKTEPMKYTVFDIETGGMDPAYLESIAPEFKPPANLRDPAKIAEALAQKRADWLETAALRATTGKVLAIGYKGPDGQARILGTEGDDEQSMLRDFWHLIRDNAWPVVGFNTHRFDLPFLIRRSMRYNLKPAPVFRGRYAMDRFIDLMQVWQCGDYQEHISLKDLAMFLGVGTKNGSGKDFAGLWATDRPAACAYLEQDIALTEACAVRMGVVQSFELTRDRVNGGLARAGVDAV